MMRSNAREILGRVVLLGLLASACIPGVGAVLTRTSAYDYDPTTGLLNKEIVEPDSSAYCVVKTYTLDGFGNRTSVTTRNCNGSVGSLPGSNSEAAAPSGDPVFATRTEASIFDSRGQFVLTSENALYNSISNPNQKESKTYNANFGTMSTLTGPNGLTTAWYFDGFGRKTFEVRADGNGTVWSYQFCSGFNGGTATCPTINGEPAVYVAVVTPVSAPINARAGTYGAVNGVTTKTYFDALGREIRAESQGFDGSGSTTAIYKDTEFDALGRVAQVSRPYFNGATQYWISSKYDALSRVILETQADQSTTATTYNGLSISIENADNQIQTTVKNGLAQVVSVTDAAGKTMALQYDPNGNLINTADDLGNSTTLIYDLKGRKTQMVDPDMGTWTYAYDALGELIRQVDAKGQTSTMSYDLLGRLIARTEPDLISNWYFDFYPNQVSCPMGIGKLCQATTNGGYSRVVKFDSLGRPASLSTTVDGVSAYVDGVTYDSNSRIATKTFPSNLVIKYNYTNLGFLQQITDGTSGASYWQANAFDAESHLETETAGNGIATQRTFDPTTGRLTAIQAGFGGSLQNFTYAYDSIGNMKLRTDGNRGLSESFTQYDALNRLKSSTLTSTAAGTINSSWSYDDLGNVTARPDGSTYTYPPSGSGSVRPHAVTKILSPAGSFVTYAYDVNGNQTMQQTTLATGVVDHTQDHTFVYTSFNMPLSLATPSVSETYTYGPEHQRTRLSSSIRGTTAYFNPGNSGDLSYERDTHLDGSTEQRSFITAYGAVVAEVKVVTASGVATTSVLYLHRDNLGSTTSISNSAGSIIEQLSYDPFGKRRFVDGAVDPSNTIKGVNTDRGFTNHEMLDELTLIHMNGRIYDPASMRFLTADPNIQGPLNMQSYNRYSYTLNNPLVLSDPSGFFSLGSWLSSTWKGVYHNQVGRLAITVAAAYFTGDFVTGEVQAFMEDAAQQCMALTIQASVAGGAAGGFAGGIVSSGGNFKQGVIGGIEGGANGWIGMEFKIPEENIAAHAALGCASAVAKGSSCGSGALAGGFSAAAAPLLTNTGWFWGAMGSAAIGGGASVLGGGKFSNGAESGAFEYLFNASVHPMPAPWGFGAGTAAGEGLADWLFAAAGRLLGPLSLLTAPSALADDSLDRQMTFYHGTDEASALALKEGAPLSIEAATSLHIDGKIGFYLADSPEAAEFFALRRANPAVVSFQMTARAYYSLIGAGADIGAIPQGQGGGFIPGNQLYLPARAFPVWDTLRASGQIR